MSLESLDTERLSSIGEFGQKKIIIPAEVKGPWRKRRTIVQAILVVFFLILPWLEIGGHQALLLDIVHREFSFFGLKLYAHDAPLLFPLIAIAVFGLLFVTSVWGRVWCGWACPQTVFIDGVFRRIEIWTEGKFIERRRSLSQPMTFKTFRRKATKWFLFFLVSSAIAHSFLAYFVGSHSLLEMMGKDPSDNMTYFILVSSMTGLILFDFGWFREQFCVIVCPYGRFQSLLLDSSSLAVIYDEKRGEPRRGLPPDGKRYGDCISCRRCVEVCPTGIDIRRGVQMECIACTACIDACDEVMEKVKKPKGLIRYSNLQGTTWTLKKGRLALLGLLIIAAASALIIGLMQRGPLDVSVLRAKGNLFQTIQEADGSKKITNQFHLHIRNQMSEVQTVSVKTSVVGVEIALPMNPFQMQPGQDEQIPMFIKFVPSVLNATGDLSLELNIQTEKPTPNSTIRSIRLIGPGPL